ncbi:MULTISPECIES: lipocalin-like domain-containing protein [Pseudoalteromonas]|uniref:Lipocalin-like domain-containing protein n=1 Tax=Pseudoalteromonas obscura TaxID=3048491 RepID=A0ABT7EKJ6_9GAMM|nr:MULTISPECIES: lipocalin-like domain-containing protein [Pseudoalteromonas]MBQ4837239.1 ABC transporter [Pseudoalteromonas luteoviolacea]MDK2595538.1 lipocalin-like domain-containing protein [Pseudoalteromonas sp. P94(2023)]
MKTKFTAIIIGFVIVIAALLQMGDEVTNTLPSAHLFSLQSGEEVEPGTTLAFPKDHGIHPKQGIEWWYVTANLESTTGEKLGVQWTLFRVSMPEVSSETSSPWWDGQFYFAHFAVQTDTQHMAFEKSGRVSDVTINAFPFEARLKNWSLESVDESFLPLSLTASQKGYRVALQLDNSPRVLHGKQGYSQKTQDGHASMYYSYPFLDVTGEVEFDSQLHTVKGRAWLDREWSSAFIDPSQAGWDWFSLQADNPADGGLMAFCIRSSSRRYEYCSATKIDENGQAQAFNNDQVSLEVLEHTQLGDVTYPTRWQLRVEGIEPVEIQSINPDSRNKLSIPYWEGRVKSRGGFSGAGYGELVGY